MYPQYELTLIRATSDESQVDEFFSPIKTDSEVAIKAFTVSDLASTEQDGMVNVGKVVTLPENYGITSGDRVRIDGVEFHVNGELFDCTKGPGSYKPGYIMYLKRGAGSGS